jgi:alpha-L-glutamate ligase-like protein
VPLSFLEIHLSNILAGLYSLAGTPDVAIVEDLVESIPGLARYSFQGVPDIRIVVFQGYPVMAMLRLATKASDGKANLHQGAVGVGLNIANGQGLNAVQFNRPITNHPDMGLALENIVIDDWDHMFLVEAGDPLVEAFEAAGDEDALVVLERPPTAEVMSLLLEEKLRACLPDTVVSVSAWVSETSELQTGGGR